MQVNTAGQDITDALNDTLNQVQKDWDNNPDKHCAVCAAMKGFPASSSWDIISLRDMGQNGFPMAGGGGQSGTGDWQRTVQVRYHEGSPMVYWGGAVNYALWGKIYSLCAKQFSASDYSLEVADTYVVAHKAAFYFDQADEAVAFTAYGYEDGNPEWSALPTGIIKNGSSVVNNQADPNNYYNNSPRNGFGSPSPLGYRLDGLVDGLPSSAP
jgi:hypothetical protein